MCVRGKWELLFQSTAVALLMTDLQFWMGAKDKWFSYPDQLSTFLLGRACDQSHSLQLRQFQTKGNGCPPEGAEEGEGARRFPRQVSLRVVDPAGREEGESQGRHRGVVGSAGPGRTAPLGQKTPPCPRSRLTRAWEVPVEASHSRKALGDHGRAERRQRRARCPPVWGWRRRGASERWGSLAQKGTAAAAAAAVEAAAGPAGDLPRATATRLLPLRPRPRPAPRVLHRPWGGSGETQLPRVERPAGWAEGQRWPGGRGSSGHRWPYCDREPGSSPEDQGQEVPFTDARGPAATVSRPPAW